MAKPEDFQGTNYVLIELSPLDSKQTLSKNIRLYLYNETRCTDVVILVLELGNNILAYFYFSFCWYLM